MNKKYITVIASVGAAAAIVAAVALPALAQTTTVSNASGTRTHAGDNIAARAAALATHIKTVAGRADQEISRRVIALDALGTRIGAMMRLSVTDKNNLSSTIESQITAMNSLQSQIAADAAANNTSSLKSAVQSITASYRIFALILPQGTIEAAADRIFTIVGTMNDLATKFSTRITAAQAAGNNVTAVQTALADLDAKVADANTQATAAVAEVASLVPDNGSSTIMTSNAAALKDARSKIQVAQQDFVVARADALTIIKALGGFKKSAAASSTASTTVQ